MAQGDYNCNLLFQKSSNKALGLILVYITFDITTFEIFQIIFDYEKLLELRPLIEEGTEALISQDMNFNDFLKECDEMRKKHYNGEITDEEFEDWKLSYPKKSRLEK